MSQNEFDSGLGGDAATESSAVGGIMGAVPGLNIFSPGASGAIAAAQADALRQKQAANAGKLGLPQFAQDPGLSYKSVGNFNPTMYSDPQAATYQTVNEDPRTRDMQMQALQRLQRYGDQAADSQEALGRYNAVGDANAMAAQREAAIRQQMQMRGQGGSAAEFVMGQGASQDAANRAQSGGMNAAMQAALQRLQGTQAAFGAAGNIRGQDFANGAHNADIINAFNMHNTDALNATRNANTGLRNQAGMYNLNNQQGLSNANVGLGMDKLNRGDRNAMAAFGAANTKLGDVNTALERRASGTTDASKEGVENGKTGYSNFKDLMTLGAGGMG